MKIISGIYQISNNIDKDVYIGSSVDVYRRWKEHIRYLKSHRHPNSRLQKAFTVVGLENLSFKILVICSREHLGLYEKEFIAYLNPAYNLSMTPERPSGNTKEFKNILLVSPNNELFVDIANASEFCRNRGDIKQPYISQIYNNARGLGRIGINGWYSLKFMDYFEPEFVYEFSDIAMDDLEFGKFL